ncbi:MAG TPA: cation diffusion facilitator family transporter [Streptosporangiaceae bacterium]|nr:cation diffusion facilitator family transporter [Streptosporangiaceae bacterium]
MMSGHVHGGSTAAEHKGRLMTVFGITVAILVAEVAGAVASGSLTLLADAGHMLTDAGGIGLSLLAIHVAQRSPSQARTFGYLRLEILAAAFNALLLFAVGIFVIVEAIRRLIHPPEVASGIMLAFGIIALCGNACSLLLLRRGQGESLNIRGAFLEVLSDFLGAGAVIVAAVIIGLTGFERADPIASLLIAALIIPRTWRLLRQAGDVLLEATPKDVDLADVRRHMLATDGVIDVHDLHAWTITSGVNVLSAHVVVSDEGLGGPVLDQLGECLADHFDIEHSTFQIEPPGHRDHEPILHR